MGQLLGAVLLGGLCGLVPLVLFSRTLTGTARDVAQLLALAGAGYGASELTDRRVGWVAAAGAAMLLLSVYEWVVASSDAAKTTVISRHTGRRLPPL